mmetsp:Transcript_3994/g.8900  ORF Transcript_3994/g.8900 Transcript_3994/m.8900 type:complete len:486 (-) Transcript_3994:45-1502(-)
MFFLAVVRLLSHGKRKSTTPPSSSYFLALSILGSISTVVTATAAANDAEANNNTCALPGQPQHSKVYIYQEEVFHHRTELERCDPGGIDGSTTDFKHSFGDLLLDYLRSGTSNQVVETDDPEEADWFYVPFDVDRSAAESNLGCGMSHIARLNLVIDALEASPYYQRYKGADHLWYLGGWELTTAGIGILPYFPVRREILHHMTVLRYSDRRVRLAGTQPHDDREPFRWNGQVSPVFEVVADGRQIAPWWKQGQDHRCTVNVPHRSNPAIVKHHPTIAQRQTKLEDWEQARPYLFNFVGVGDDYPYITGQREGVQRLVQRWHKTAELLPPDKIFNVNKRLAPDEFAASMAKSRFCIVIRGDEPSRTRFYDALSAGCIPIDIEDGFRDFGAGYNRMMHNYDAFTLSIPESHWLVHAPSALMHALTMPRNELRHMHASLMEVRPKLLFHLDNEGKGENSSVAAEYIFRALNERCLLNKDELLEYASA